MSLDAQASADRLPALPSGSLAPEAPQPRRYYGYYKRRASAMYELQMREHCIRRRLEGATVQQIASELHQSVSTIRRYLRQALERAVSLVPFDPRAERFDEDQPWHKPPPRNKRRGSFSDPTGDPDVLEGDVLPPPDEIELRQEALQMAKAAKPYSIIADVLGISEKQARQFVHEELTKLEKSELNGADLQRRLMIEQLNEAIEAVYAPATGSHPEKGKVAPVLEAVDRLMKLLKQKAELMGLHQPQYMDIEMQLVALAEEAGYDIHELHDVARDVLQRHRIKIPGMRAPVR